MASSVDLLGRYKELQGVQQQGGRRHEVLYQPPQTSGQPGGSRLAWWGGFLENRINERLLEAPGDGAAKGRS